VRGGTGFCRAGRPSLTESLLFSVAILAVAPHADARFHISLVVPAQERFLEFCVRSVAFHAARCVAFRPIPRLKVYDTKKLGCSCKSWVVSIHGPE